MVRRKPKQAARSKSDAVERSEAKALCRSPPTAGGEELAASGGQVRPDRAAAVAGAEPTASESPAQGGNGGAGEKLSPAKALHATRPIFHTINILNRATYEDWHDRFWHDRFQSNSIRQPVSVSNTQQEIMI